MANPQKENGYTPIANEILEALSRAKLNGTQHAIIDVILRYTYGFNRKSHSLSEGFISNATGYHKIQISKELKKLLDMKIILETKPPTYSTSREIMFNKNYVEWEQRGLQLVNSLTVNQKTNTTVSESTNTTVSESANQEIHNINTNIKTNVCAFFESLWQMYPNKKSKQAVSKKSLKEINKIGYDEMARCIQRYVDTKPEWQAYQNGSTFFNSGYVDYLDCNYEDEEPHEAKLPVITAEVIDQLDNQNFRTADELSKLSLEEMFS